MASRRVVFCNHDVHHVRWVWFPMHHIANTGLTSCCPLPPLRLSLRLGRSCGVPAWEHAADDQAAYNVNQQGQLPALLAHWGFDARMSAPCIDLVVRMLAHAPAARLAFGAVLAHPYVGLLPPPP